MSIGCGKGQYRINDKPLPLITKYLFSFDKRSFWISLFMPLASVTMGLAMISVPKYFIDLIGKGDTHGAFILLAIFAMGILLLAGLLSIGNYFLNIANSKRRMKVALDLVHYTYKIDIECLENKEFLNLHKRLLNGMQHSCDDYFSTMRQFVTSILMLISISAIFSTLNVAIVLISLVAIIIDLILAGMLNNQEYKKNVQLEQFYRRANVMSRIFYLSNSLREIRNYSLEDFTLNKARDMNKDGLAVESEYYRSTGILGGLKGIAQLVMLIVPMALFGMFVFNGTMEISTYFLYVGLYTQFSHALRDLLQILPNISKISLMTKDYFHFIHNLEYTSLHVAQGQSISQIEELSLVNVSYKYLTEETETLQNLNLSIRKGEKIAIVGENGAGKTTMIKLISGFYRPTKGTVIINDVPIEEYNTAELRQSMSILFQDYYIFPFSFMENLTWDPAKHEELWMFLHRYSLNKRVKALKYGLDTGIGGEYYDHYTDLSGGEKQKIAIIRMLLKSEASMLILDEPMNNLEIRTENRLYDDILSQKDKTIIIISHRMSFMPKVDKIVVMDNGYIVECGSHVELMENGGKYASLFAMQKEKYTEQI